MHSDSNSKPKVLKSGKRWRDFNFGRRWRRSGRKLRLLLDHAAGLFINDIFGFNDSAALASNLIADDIPSLLQLFECGADSVHAFLSDSLTSSPRVE